MGNIFQLLALLIIFGTGYGIIRMLIHRKERLIMVEKGTSMPEIKPEQFAFSSLKFGILFIGIGVGVLIANILTVTTKLDKEVAYFSMIFLFGGVALLISHLIESKNKNDIR